MIRLIREEEPPRPSVRLSSVGDLPGIAAARHTEPGRLATLVQGELDWIVMRCLEKDRSRRYETASALAKDAERYLSDEPVEACPPSAGYRLRKFGRKHRGPLVAASLVFLWQQLGGMPASARCAVFSSTNSAIATTAVSPASGTSSSTPKTKDSISTSPRRPSGHRANYRPGRGNKFT